MVQAGWNLSELRSVGLSLEEIFLQLTAAEKADKKDDKKKDDKKGGLLWGRPWWVWLLVVLAAIAIVVIILLLLRGCEHIQPGPDGGLAITVSFPIECESEGSGRP